MGFRLNIGTEFSDHFDIFLGHLCEINDGIHIYQLPLNFYASVCGCGCSFGFEHKLWQIDEFGGKRHGSADLHIPIHPPHALSKSLSIVKL